MSGIAWVSVVCYAILSVSMLKLAQQAGEVLIKHSKDPYCTIPGPPSVEGPEDDGTVRVTQQSPLTGRKKNVTACNNQEKY